MENTINHFSHKITTMIPVTLGMIAITLYLIFESANLIMLRLPEFMTGWQRYAASWFLAFSLHLTVITTAVNSRIVSIWFSLLFTLFTTAVTGFFFDIYQVEGKDLNEVAFGYVITTFVGAVNFAYVYLFVNKYDQERKEKSKLDELPILRTKLNEMERELNEKERQINDYERDVTNLQRRGNDYETKLNEYETMINDSTTNLNRQLSSLERDHFTQLRAALEKRLCEGCGTVVASKESLSVHKRDCDGWKRIKEGGKVNLKEILKAYLPTNGVH